MTCNFLRWHEKFRMPWGYLPCRNPTHQLNSVYRVSCTHIHQLLVSRISALRDWPPIAASSHSRLLQKPPTFQSWYPTRYTGCPKIIKFPLKYWSTGQLRAVFWPSLTPLANSIAVFLSYFLLWNMKHKYKDQNEPCSRLSRAINSPPCLVGP